MSNYLLSLEQITAIEAVVEQWADVPGSYEDTMLQGLVHGYLDSGILTDGLSADDARRVSEAGLDEEFDLDVLNREVIAHDGGAPLQCIQVVDALLKIADEHNSLEDIFLRINEEINFFETIF